MELSLGREWGMRHIARVGLVLLAALAFGGANGQQLTANFDDITTLPGAGWVLTNNSVAPGTVGWFQGNPAVFSSQQLPRREFQCGSLRRKYQPLGPHAHACESAERRGAFVLHADGDRRAGS